MRVSEYLRFPPMRAAVAALVLALVYVVWALAGALRDASVPPATVRQTAALALKSPPPPATVDVDAVIAADPFSPDRSAPDEAFRMPGEAAPQVVASGARPTVLGTAVSPNGNSFATATLGTNRPKILREGDQLGEFTVKSIERGHVVFAAAGGTRLDIAASAAPTPGPSNATINPNAAFTDTSDAYGARFGRGATRGRRGRGGAGGD